MTDKLLNEEVSVYHKIGEDSEGNSIYKIFKLSNVRIEKRDSIYASNRGLKPYDGFKLYFIPNKSSVSDDTNINLEYVSAINYDNMKSSEKSNLWTVAENDLITETTENIPEDKSITELCGSYNFYYVNSIIPCRGMGKLKLLEITGRGRSVDSD